MLVGAEPSARWLKSRSHSEKRIELGLRNFGDGRECVSAHYAVERWLPGQARVNKLFELDERTRAFLARARPCAARLLTLRLNP
jgi:hypothetical protein